LTVLLRNAHIDQQSDENNIFANFVHLVEIIAKKRTGKEQTKCRLKVHLKATVQLDGRTDVELPYRYSISRVALMNEHDMKTDNITLISTVVQKEGVENRKAVVELHQR